MNVDWKFNLFLVLITLIFYSVEVKCACGPGISCVLLPSCTAGTYCSGGSPLGPCYDNCLSCPAGQYQLATIELPPSTLAYSCNPVDAGCYGSGGSSCPFPCIAGQYSTGGAPSCSPCPGGYSCPFQATTPLICSTTQYSTGGASACSPLPPGCYSLAPGSTSSCPLAYSPTSAPLFLPTVVPSSSPTMKPTVLPSFVPTTLPTIIPTQVPTIYPSYQPTIIPTVIPTKIPSIAPSYQPTRLPTTAPTLNPTSSPSSMPSTVSPSRRPSVCPSLVPLISAFPTTIPSVAPTIFPTKLPTSVPSVITNPSVEPSPPVVLQSNSNSNTQNSFIQSASFIVVIVICSLLCLLLLVSLYILHMRWSLKNHSTQLWNWVANDLGGEVMVMIRGSRRLEKDSMIGIEIKGVSVVHGDGRRSMKLSSATDLSGNAHVQTDIQEGFL